MNIPVRNCSSCGACANACARGAITMQLDQEGFYRPVIDETLCSKCGTCERTCPWTNMVQNPNGSFGNPKTVAAFSKDEQVRYESSSGGIFSVLAERMIDDGGVVAGVAQLTATHFGHIIVDNKANLAKLRGSKYVQADAGLVYKQVRSLLRDGKKVLFSGTPCQVAALYAVLGKNNFENLVTVDIVCHGTPSVKVWEKYVSSLNAIQKSQLKKTAFRDKSTGWKSYSILNEFVNGETQSTVYGKSDYMRLFLSRICQNESCSNCRYRKLPRIADITLGDFWGVANYHPNMDDDKGTSVVLLNTEHGAEFFDSIKKEICKCDSSIENAIAGNPCIVRSSKPHFRRKEFFRDLQDYSMDELVKKYCKSLPLYKIILLKLRAMLG